MTAVAFSPDGKLLAAGGQDMAVVVWDVATRRQAADLRGHTGWVQSVAFSPDGKLLASGSADGTVGLWNVANWRPVRYPADRGRQGGPGGRVQPGWHAHGLWRRVLGHALGRRGPNATRPATPGTRQHRPGRRVQPATARSSPRAARTAPPSCGTRPRVGRWASHSPAARTAYTPLPLTTTPPTGRCSRPGTTARSCCGTWRPGSRWACALASRWSNVSTVAYSPDGTRLATGNGSSINLWEMTDQPQLRTLAGHTGTVDSVAFSPDGTLLASGSDDKTLKIWDVATGNLLQTLTGHTRAVVAVAFSPDGKQVASGSWDNTVRRWDVATGKDVGQPLTAHGNKVYTVAFSPDGKHLLSGGMPTPAGSGGARARRPEDRPTATPGSCCSGTSRGNHRSPCPCPATPSWCGPRRSAPMASSSRPEASDNMVDPPGGAGLVRPARVPADGPTTPGVCGRLQP